MDGGESVGTPQADHHPKPYVCVLLRRAWRTQDELAQAGTLLAYYF
jgi:hypothetical protein